MNKLKALFQHWTVSLKLFPVAHLIFVYLTALGMYAVWYSSDQLGFLLLAGGLALVWSLMGPMLRLHAPEVVHGKLWNWGLQGLSMVIGVGMYFWLRQMFTFDEVDFWSYQVIGIFLVSILLLFLLQAWWYRKKEAGLHVAISEFVSSGAFGGLAGLVVFAGIAGTFASIEALFDVDVSSKVYECLGVFCSAFLTGTFALNAYSLNMQSFLNARKEDQPLTSSRLARIFGLYIFLPLTMVYLAIFLAYGLKILITGNWPRGVIVWMGIAYVAGALFTYYLTYFQQGKAIEVLRKVLFSSFLLIAGLMAGAIALRVSQYGITIDRYLVMMFVVFVVLSAIGLLVWKEKRMLIVISLFTLLSAVSFFGPLNAMNVAWDSQVAKLKTLLHKQGVVLPLGSGSLEKVEDTDRQIEDILRYLIRNYSEKKLHNGLLKQEIVCDDVNFSSYYCLRQVFDQLGFEKLDFVSVDDDRYFSFYADFHNVSLGGYKTLYKINRYTEQQGHVKLYSEGEVVDLDFSSHFPVFEKRRVFEPSSVYVVDQGRIKILLTRVAFTKNKDDQYSLDDLEGYLLLK